MTINDWITSDLAITSSLSFYNDRLYNGRDSTLLCAKVCSRFQNFDLSLKGKDNEPIEQLGF